MTSSSSPPKVARSINKATKAKSHPSSEDDLYVSAGMLGQAAPLIAGVPTVVIELGTDNGPSAVGLLRRVELGTDGRIIGVYVEVEDDLSSTVVQSSVGFRIIQGRYAEKEYGRYVRKMVEYAAETDEQTDQRDAAPSPPPALLRALAAATGGRIMGVEVEVDEDDEDDDDFPLKH